MQRGKVVVTGASTGIGEATALRLKAAGFDVLAGVRKDADAERLREKGIDPVIVDVTNADQVKSLAETVGDRLDGAREQRRHRHRRARSSFCRSTSCGTSSR